MIRLNGFINVITDRFREMIPLIIFAKVPIPGFAKTRIAEACGIETADRIYHELLVATAHSVTGFLHHVAFTGAKSPGKLTNVFPRAHSFIAQIQGTLGERLHGAFESMFAHKAEAAIAIGCDCPFLTKRHFRQAIDLLQHDADVVIAPALDGGYTLIGCRPHSLAVFQASSWGKPQLLDETIEIIQLEGLKLHLLETLSDIDTLADYKHWKKEGHPPLST